MMEQTEGIISSTFSEDNNEERLKEEFTFPSRNEVAEEILGTG